jgi:hypothetical protein
MRGANAREAPFAQGVAIGMPAAPRAAGFAIETQLR